MARHHDGSARWFWVLPSLVAPLVVAAVAWTGHVASEGERIAPNVSLAGIDVSGLDREEASARVRARERDVLQTPVTIVLGERDITLPAEELGFDYLATETLDELMSARHADGPWSEFTAWVRTPFRRVTVADRIRLHEERARERLTAEDFVLVLPVEPGLEHHPSQGITVVPGELGVMADADQVVAALTEADVTSGPIEVAAALTGLPPTVSDQRARDLAADLNDKTGHGMVAAVDGFITRLGPAQLRRHLVTEVGEGTIVARFDLEGFRRELEAMYPDPVGEFVKPRFAVSEGAVVVLEEGAPAPVCCTTESVEETARAILEQGAPIYHLQPRPNDDPDALAWARGSLVGEMVATFTTRHPCCESRVTNIHTMADAMTGYYLLPGETLSLNEYIGPRTRDNGYVAAGAIRGGHMTDEVGGGVSQFVTTLFNAAFFAGLDLDEYQSHSVYFSRYPFGREATLSIPGPDLVLTNSTAFPVLIWPTYDSTSITVSMYSTKDVEVEELDQRVSRQNLCTHSEIDRRRTFSDGRVVVDTIVANYRPGDGIDCNGRPIPEP